MRQKLLSFIIDPGDYSDYQVGDLTEKVNLNEYLEQGWVIKTFTSTPVETYPYNTGSSKGDRVSEVLITVLLQLEE